MSPFNVDIYNYYFNKKLREEARMDLANLLKNYKKITI